MNELWMNAIKELVKVYGANFVFCIDSLYECAINPILNNESYNV